ncbi:hypothetical protein SLE2022_098150 [Rubroshorea leprosula]
MPSFFSATSCSVLSARAFQSSSAFPFLPQNPRKPSRISSKAKLGSILGSLLGLKATIELRVQSSVKSGLVIVNGRVFDKVISHNLRAGDKVNCVISDLQPLRTEPEDIPLDIVYEDQHVLFVNKPSPGNASGTLVNGLLHRCSLLTAALPEEELLSDTEDVSDDEGFYLSSCQASIHPGIVHRLDKGTSGLLAAAKDEHSRAHLSEQFKLHTIQTPESILQPYLWSAITICWTC